MIDDKPHLIEKEVLDLRKYTVSALFLLKIIEVVIICMMLKASRRDAQHALKNAEQKGLGPSPASILQS